MMALRLEQNQGLVHTLAPHLRQSLKILQVPAVELRNLVLEELQLNPVLEELPGKEISLEESLDEENYRGKTDLENDTEKRNSENEEYVSEDLDPVGTSKDSERRDFFLNALVYPTSLKEHLLRQARMMDLSEAQMEVIQYAVDSLDHRGFLTPTEADISRQTGQSLTTVQSALGALRSLEPVGIACTDTRSCLFTQLMAQGKGESISARFLREHYEDLLRNRVTEMMHHLGVDGATLRRSIEEISRLDPAPGRHFETEIVQGIVPDILVYRGPYGEWMIQVNNDFIPSLRIQPTYRELMDRPDLAPEDKNYLRMKMRSGHYLIQSLLQRQRTIERITRALLEVQEDFFQKGPQGLQPLTLAQLAERLNVHETTVSRATANKFIETPFGVFEFRYFFTTGLANPEGCSVANTVVKQKISHIIRQEDGRNPVSDQEIVGLLKKDSICIARRTVAKYREALGLPAAHLRKKIY